MGAKLWNSIDEELKLNLFKKTDANILVSILIINLLL